MKFIGIDICEAIGTTVVGMDVMTQFRCKPALLAVLVPRLRRPHTVDRFQPS